MRKVIKNEAEATGEVLLYDVIGGDWMGEGVTAKSFAEAVKDMGDVKTITLRINSPGGSVWDGLAIYNTLHNHPAKKVVVIEGLAASAASFVAMAGDEITMAENGIFMIHLAQGMTYGDKTAHAKSIEMLAKHDETIAKTYAARAGKEPNYFLDLMTAETWMSAEEALGHGLITSVLPAKGQPEACVGPECSVLNAFKQIPEKAKVFFKKQAAANAQTLTAAASGKESTVAKNKGCNCNKVKNKAGYAAAMNAAIDAAVTEERSREAILQELADASGLEVDAVSALFTDDGDCPTAENVAAFAGVSGMPSEDDQKAAAMADGCEFAEAPPEEPEPENAEEECDVCDGTGKCIKCDGTGKETDYDYDEGARKIECQACDGTGDCPICDGSGVIDQAKKVAARIRKIERDEVRARLAEIGA